MWLFTSDGFVSIVADRSDVNGDRLLVRSRDRMHITNVFPDAEVFSKQPSDYQWRAWVSRKDVSEVMLNQVHSLDYTNFKNSIFDDKYHDACLDVWNAMYRAY